MSTTTTNDFPATKESPLSGSAASSFDGEGKALQFSAEEERAVVRKIDWALLPGLTLLYLLSFLDRSNVGNAKLYGMLTDIGVTDASVYNTSLALYFIGYCLFEVPANLILKRFNPKVWLPTLTVVWGIVATLQGIVKDEAGFLVARTFMGIAEAGLFPGCIFVISMYYKRNERHWRVAVFFGGAALAGAFGGVLSWAIGHIHAGGLGQWAWIFIIEGIFTVLVGLTAYFWVPGYPLDAKFLNQREKDILIARLTADSDSGDKEPFSWAGVRAAFKDHLVISYALLFHAFAFPLYTLSLFLPTIIAGLGYASWQAQLLTTPPYAVAFLAILLFAWGSHVQNRRGLYVILGGAVALVGYVVLLSTHTAGARYAGIFITVVGIYPANALLLSWPSENVSPQTKRATSTAIQIFIGDFGAVTGVLIYRPSLNANFFRTPHIIAIGYTVLGMLIAAYLWIYMARENDRRAAIREQSGKQEAEVVEAGGRRLGDKHVAYVYQL
ncbi:major facilitator superfamily domain-containing protein [Leucosporidium creatinivorum]|uniref:Major facilitator superfamily domain-containing protein n=1 Tax=Leucosporidium creatinivorum TaxID=106004 RepID=A0A1Y2EY31_9BASI|nr:major facilitator superfamily domain-containing protein [Leucosporidium creatinivorum]